MLKYSLFQKRPTRCRCSPTIAQLWKSQTHEQAAHCTSECCHHSGAICCLFEEEEPHIDGVPSDGKGDILDIVFMFPNWFTSIPTCSSCSGLCFVHTHTLGGVDACWKRGGGGLLKLCQGMTRFMCAEGVERSCFYYPIEPGLFLSGRWRRGRDADSELVFVFFLNSKGKWARVFDCTHHCADTFFCVCVLCVIAPVKRGRREEFVHVDVQWTPSRLFISPEGSLCRSLFLFLAHSLSFFFSFSPVSFLWFHLPESHSDGCNRSQKALRVVETLSMKAFTVSPWLPPLPSWQVCEGHAVPLVEERTGWRSSHKDWSCF